MQQPVWVINTQKVDGNWSGTMIKVFQMCHQRGVIFLPDATTQNTAHWQKRVQDLFEQLLMIVAKEQRESGIKV